MKVSGEFEYNYKGNEIQNATQKATEMGINKVMADCVVHSKDIVPYDTGTLHNSLKILDFATKEGNQTIGRWGSAAVNYAIFVEFGTIRMSAQPYLRPSADLQYKNLSKRIEEFTNYG